MFSPIQPPRAAAGVTPVINDIDSGVVAIFAASLKSGFSSEAGEKARAFATQQRSLSKNRIKVSDIKIIVQAISFDSDKLDAIRALEWFITERTVAYDELSQVLSFSSSKEELYKILFTK